MINEDPKSAELIRPILRGRDIKRYGYDFAGLYLIATFPSKHYDIEKYPAIKKWLQSFGEKLEQNGKEYIDKNGKKQKCRKKTNNKWFETQDSIAYWNDFSQPKIIYPNMTKFLPFILDMQGFMTNQKCFILVSKTNDIDLRFLTAYFNSSLAKKWLKDNCPELQGQTRELSKIFFENILIPKCSNEQIKDLIDIVEKNLQTAINMDEYRNCVKNIDKIIYDIFEISNTEREHIENYVKDIMY